MFFISSNYSKMILHNKINGVSVTSDQTGVRIILKLLTKIETIVAIFNLAISVINLAASFYNFNEMENEYGFFIGAFCIVFISLFRRLMVSSVCPKTDRLLPGGSLIQKSLYIIRFCFLFFVICVISCGILISCHCRFIIHLPVILLIIFNSKERERFIVL